ncbi:MAG: bifunctional phosphopantothenoylcysteine decarboxylase/phosphopantothenate--cysteine ligase CoaBC [Rhodocyclaceae bacterium]|jgi:phosphopantothenoylcysteine decarboxylase/phosphopantothenate--cysteine ligase|nr:bifunctional phosphopantothenoylcysteine decarboxylase/phosphopantothenate--cysteine ligase CoaBC [Rhodocyclaceae bacterium]HNQ57265.1 bifunctional phosphopantothenoylcysteine decarboxylase/phosphopantothenate--cysteine ligase CoaBC [Candidatus Desulfobacillus denitrificans]MBV6409985.1 Coenzyme A biosynthesis bifunctional protein CoaBC [Rhodocyclaceae bacterium]MCC7269807.1 bifunctional phosphopantothenoylcysteine decarboxylase/phosphopantothenate--cysteine ligase CoaBC [Rhodocyclaceae bacte
MAELKGKRLVLGVTGGIAAYKAAELARRLVRDGAEVHAVLTASGARFVTPVTFQALTGRLAWCDAWDARMPDNMAHIELSRAADAIVVAPASADFLARLAHGRADDLLSALCLARDCPLLVAPAMNRQMWENPATQRNKSQLLADGVTILGPAAGEQACGETGLGRMLEPEEIHDALVGFFQPKLLAGRRLMLTAGPTFEALDAVRGLTNPSSGKMGFALARAARDAGAEVTLVAGPVALPTPFGVTRIDVTSAREMHAAVMQRVDACDIFIGVAAVADYRPAEPVRGKMKKGDQPIAIALTPNPDILAEVAARPRPPFCVGFAAESHDLEKYAEDKRRKKKVDLVVGNLVQEAMGSDSNAVILFDDQGRHPLGPAPKIEIARGIVAHVGALLAGNGGE